MVPGDFFYIVGSWLLLSLVCKEFSIHWDS